MPPMLASDQEKLFKSYDFGVSHADELFLLFRQTGLLSDRNEILRTEKDQLMIKVARGYLGCNVTLESYFNLAQISDKHIS